jgi:Leucine-rich repeat (LRR) protein
MFSCRYLPPEIGCLNNLEYLDLSFNKMKSLPTEISYLNALISLKVANNKLVEIPSGLSSLQKLENLDLSNNRLTSIGALELDSMHNLQKLNLQVIIYDC